MGQMTVFAKVMVVVRGAGDIASGVIYRLHRAGFPVVVLELPTPLFVRRAVAYGQAVFDGAITVDGVTARLAPDAPAARQVIADGEIPVLIDPEGASLAELQPTVIVDGRMEKRNLGSTMQDAPLVIGLGPGFTAGVDVHAVIETNRGHDLGRVMWQGAAEADTGTPGAVRGVTKSRILRAPADGHVLAKAQIGDMLREGELIAEVNSEPIVAPFDGVLRGIVHERVDAWKGMKVGDLDPRGVRRNCFTISEKSLAVGGGVLEAVLSVDVVREGLQSQL